MSRRARRPARCPRCGHAVGAGVRSRYLPRLHALPGAPAPTGPTRPAPVPDAPPPPARSLPRRIAQLGCGFVVWGVAVSLMVRSGLGLGPWDALHVGLDATFGVGVGVASILVGVAILAASLPLGVRPGVATVGNMVMIGVVIDAVLPLLPPAHGPAWGAAYHLGGIALAGWGTGLYIAARLGAGPRDGLVLALAARWRWPVRRVRTVVELAALVLGWALGGRLGLGTIVYAVLIGPSMQWGLRLWGVLPAPATPRAAAAPVGRAA